ncbi:MAG: hypothetical protein H0X24_03960 [Ktedonobacterales bacterium]|nr:hypothetical protein [Ktedonobacterales bacterium]
MTSEGQPRAPDTMAEVTTADLIIGLPYRVQGIRHFRQMKIVKVRGA